MSYSSLSSSSSPASLSSSQLHGPDLLNEVHLLHLLLLGVILHLTWVLGIERILLTCEKKPLKVLPINVHLVVVIIELCQGLVDGQLHNTWVHSFKNIKTFGPAPNITTILPWKSGLAEQSLESPKLIWHPRSSVYNPANH